MAAHRLGLLLLLALPAALRIPAPAQGGNCWSLRVRSNGRCTELLSEKVSRDECCRSASVATAWSSEDLDSGALFFWRVLGGGVPCRACKESCAGVDCGEGRRCEVRRGQPRCVCAPDCRGGGGGGGGAGAGAGAGRSPRRRGPVCGSDGRTYRSLCRLRKRACRRKTAALTVAYEGHCQTSCERLRCPPGKHCLLDQNLRPHCVKCATRRCPRRGHAVCGADGVTYLSSCHLRGAACLRGRAIPEAYRGPCKPAGTAVSCGAVRCRERQACLLEPSTGAPRCVTCSYRCPKGGDLGGPICGSNNLTYASWCHMLKDACDTGYVIETRFAGRCSDNQQATAVATATAADADAQQRLPRPPALNCSSSPGLNGAQVTNAIPGLSNSVGPGEAGADEMDEPCEPPTLA